MDVIKGQGSRKRNSIIKTWERCKSIGRGSKITSRPVRSLTAKSKSWPRLHPHKEEEEEKGYQNRDHDNDKKHSSKKVAPEGCFSVYVGPQKQRFVVKTEYANHPLFKILLEEAESEYGYNPEGPLALPCNVDVFYKVLLAIDDNDDETTNRQQGCSYRFSKKGTSYRLLSPSRMISMNNL